MISLPLSTLAKILATPVPDTSLTFTGISTDTRTLLPGNLYIALTGDNFDGHQFLATAQTQGAVAAIVTQLHPELTLPQILVIDGVKALGAIARFWRQQFTLPIVGLTGSNGKTTLKNMVALILRAASKGHTDTILATQGNFNNHIGVPKLLAELSVHHRYAVVEMGMNHFGEITYLTNMALPTVAIINNAAPAHLAGVNNLAGVARAKGEIFLGLDPKGIAILNKDDAFYSYWCGLIGQREAYSFGLTSTADVYATIHPASENVKQLITIVTPRDRFDVELPLLGKHNVMNALAASAAAVALRIPAEFIKAGLEAIEPAKGRLQLQTYADDFHLIDDTYNANPASLTAAVNVLASFAGNKILVLGDMVELGDNTDDLHANMGTVIREAGIDHLLTYGKISAEIAKNFGESAQHFPTQSALVEALKPYLKPRSTLLIKGSRLMAMEKVVAAVKAELTSNFASA